MIGLLVLSFVTFQPPRPTVGDPITITFAVQTTVDASPDYEVISRSGNSVVIRTFVPHTITVNGRSADGPVSVMVPIHSVLKPDDNLEPAPLKPPNPESWPRLPFVAIGISAIAAIGVWTVVSLLARRRVPKPRIVVVPVEQFRNTVLTLQRDPRAPMRWARLADAVRAYLASVRADWGSELTTSELLTRIEDVERRRAAGPAAVSQIAGEPPAVQPPSRRRYDAYIATILRQGDLEKFSPWGAAPADFEESASHALEIPAWVEPPVVVQDEVAA